MCVCVCVHECVCARMCVLVYTYVRMCMCAAYKRPPHGAVSRIGDYLRAKLQCSSETVSEVTACIFCCSGELSVECEKGLGKA